MAKPKVNYEMKINSLQQSADGTVVMSNFTLTGNDGTHAASVTYSVNLLPPAEGKPFTPVDEITQEQGVQWTIDALNAPGKIGIEGAKEEVLRELMKQKAPQTKPAALPWLV